MQHKNTTNKKATKKVKTRRRKIGDKKGDKINLPKNTTKRLQKRYMEGCQKSFKNWVHIKGQKRPLKKGQKNTWYKKLAKPARENTLKKTKKNEKT